MTKLIGRFAFLALFVVSVSACESGEAAEAASSVETVEVVRGNLLISAEATGTVEPIREVEVKSKASGEILRLHADIGDEVRPGQILADIDPRDVQNRFDQTEADLEVAQVRLEIAESQIERSTLLLEREVITAQEHEGARVEYANSRANLVKARTNHELAVLQLEDVRITAPMSGTIIQKNVEEGMVIQSASGNVSGGTTLFLMANLGEMQVRTLVDETDMGQLEPGMVANVTVEAFPDRTFRGEVQKIEPQATVEQNVTMFAVIVSIDNSGRLLKPGMNAEVEVMVDEAVNVLVVPNNAIVKTTDVGPAAMALGLDVENMDLTAFMRAGGGGFNRGREGGPGAGRGGDGAQHGGGERGQRGGGDGQSARGGQRGGGPGGAAAAQMQALQAQLEAGEITQDEMRARMQSAMAGFAGFGGEGGPPRRSRAAVVFVMGADSVPTPRQVQIGLNDWDRTQIVSGVEEGEVLVVVGAAQLMAQQQAFLDQMRERMGGGNPFGGGTRGGMGGGRGRR
ncbi:MAG TPA: efflux RND transporter periplasmic adaptor subunit [Gemmatimonadetes bacterium]|jgi:HlyD family secretion protein|nr:efflux RND transporter periplasmic adaptor subunit [Gemmatimonadota bacterium]HBE00160.1 efflux RND transporter periplasmic adaptor subunit [Gemmatimonadota bacterium]HIN52164.1 efflux RND transporter periplasmic adaptor subunit [Gemmatimonadota bacterium]